MLNVVSAEIAIDRAGIQRLQDVGEHTLDDLEILLRAFVLSHHVSALLERSS